MSDDLKDRLRANHLDECYEAIDRIEELEAKLKTYDEIGWALEEDAGQLRAKLAKAVEALEFYATRVVTYHNVGTVTFHGGDDNGQTARAALTEISGGGDT